MWGPYDYGKKEKPNPLGSLELHPQVVAICAMVKAWCLVYGHPSNDRIPDSVHKNPFQNGWMTIT